jgi:general secretion pathway protein B
MSYILDALRRSQAERDHGQVPGLHAQPTLSSAAAAPAAAPRWLWPALAVAGLLLLLAGLTAVLMRTEKPVAPQATVPAASVTAPVVAAPVAPVAPIAPIAPVATVAAVAPVARNETLAAVPPLPASAAAALAVAAARQQPPPMVVSAPVTAPTVAAAAPAARPAAPASAAKLEPKLISWAQLSAEQRRELPSLAVGGSIWSESAANRFVIFNGQIVHEGESAAPGVVLERISAKAAWLRWRELRIEVPL